MEDKKWRPWIAVYTDGPSRGDDIFILKAVAKHNEGGDPDDVHIRNGRWSDWEDEPLMPYTDLELRCQASPLGRTETPHNLITPYAYSVGIGDVYPNMELRRMERQIKVLRKFAKGYRYGKSTGEMDSFAKWTAAITQFAMFLKAQGFVLRTSDGDRGSWDDTPKHELVLFDSESPLKIYSHIHQLVRSKGYEIEPIGGDV